MSDWRIFRGADEPHDSIQRLPQPPPWRDFQRSADERGRTFRTSPREVELVNAALYLRRPLLVTGPPGSGKSSLAYAVARELALGAVLVWPINSRSTLQEGLYQYDALARLRDANLEQYRRRQQAAQEGPGEEDVGRYLRLGPLGTALWPRPRPRVLLIDEIDKSDLDLPNDLLHVFEEGYFEVPELVRIADRLPEVMVLPADGKADEDRVRVLGGKVRCDAFPLVVLTSNAERELPPAFLRRCLRLDLPTPDLERLRDIVAAHLPAADKVAVEQLLVAFVQKRDQGCVMATDQLLNAVFLLCCDTPPQGEDRQRVTEILLRELGRT